MEETVPVFFGQLKLGCQREHGFIEIPQYSFDRAGILMAVVDVVVQTDELPVWKTNGEGLVA